MGLIQDIESRLLSAIKKLFEPVITPLVKLWNILKGFFAAIIDLIPETIQLVKDVIFEVNAWRQFRQNISFKSGVINLQSVRDAIEDLVQEFIDAWHALVGLFTDGFKLPLKSVSEAADAAEEVVVAFEDFFGKVGLREAIQKLSTSLEKAGGKALEILAIIQAVAEAALRVVRQLQTIVNAARDARELFQTGKGLFLQQNNRRRVLKLDDGTSIKIRLGNLHPA